MELVLVKNIEGVKELVSNGYCPVECSFGGVSVVDELQMDHHGSMSHLESVAIRAYRDHYGARQQDARFVVNHVDADSIFAVAALAGLLPHPQCFAAQAMPAFKQRPWLVDLLPLAQTIATIDTDPIGRDIIAMPYGDVLITWDAMFGFGADDDLAAIAAVQGWRQLLTAPACKVFLAAAKDSEQERVASALADLRERGEKVGQVLILKQSRVFGFAEWYQRQPEAGAATEAAGWEHQVAIALTEQQAITFGTPNQSVAEQVLGKGGLTNVFAKLNEFYGLEPGAGFGGRDVVGGSPRGMKMTEEDLRKAAKVANDIIAANAK